MPFRSTPFRSTPFRSLPTRRRPIILCALVLAVVLPCSGAARASAHAIAMHGDPAMPEDFKNVPYANPDAPKGGRLVEGILGTFDSLNPFIVKGISLPSIRGYVVEIL